MPRTAGRRATSADEAKRALWLGMGDAWSLVAELLSATAVWGAIGFGADRLLGTYPLLLALGAVVGHATGIYIVWRRTKAMGAQSGRPGGTE